MQVKENAQVIYMLTDSGLAKLKALFDNVESDAFIDTLMSVERAMDHGDIAFAVNGGQTLILDDSDFEPVTYFFN